MAKFLVFFVGTVLVVGTAAVVPLYLIRHKASKLSKAREESR